jgi:type IV secretory pathway VirB10-like protein
MIGGGQHRHDPADPLARRHIVPSGPHVPRLLLVAGGMVALGLVGFLLMRGSGGDPPALSSRFVQQAPEPKLPTYADLAPREPPPPPAPKVRLEPKPPPPAAAKPAAEKARDQLWDKAMDAGVGGWTRGDHRREAQATAASTTELAQGGERPIARFQPTPGDCFVPPGTPIPAQTITRTVTERGGILTAMVTSDLWSAGFDCLAVPAGSTLTMAYGTSVTKGQKRIEILDPTIVRPWPRSDTVQLTAMTADATGAAGLPGWVDVPWFRTGALIAASTAVDLGVAALSGGGSLIGAILGRNVDRPLDKAAKDLLDRAPVITLESGESIIVVLRGGLLAEDFRAG